MKAYKGFNHDMTCRGFQYEEGKTYEEDTAELCKKGFHACEAPLDVLTYYPPVDDSGNMSKYHVVELDEVSEKRSNDDTKRCAKKITIGAELNLFGLAKAHVEWVKEQIDHDKDKSDNGDQSAATNTGNQSAATNTGNQSAATNTGDWSAATNTGDQSAATNTGYQSAATNTGDRSAATNTGDRSAATAGGKDSVAIAWGIESKAKAALGSYIVLAEWEEDDDGNYTIKCAKMHRVDGKTIKPDTFYMLKGGKFVEVEE